MDINPKKPLLDRENQLIKEYDIENLISDLAFGKYHIKYFLILALNAFIQAGQIPILGSEL